MNDKDIILWSCGEWNYREESQRYMCDSDGYEVIPYESFRWVEMHAGAEAS